MSASIEQREPTGYYGVPPIHKAHWHWLIITYFFAGGISAGSYVIASVAELLGGEAGRRIARTGRYVSLAFIIPSPLLLILDLRRPDRFLNMLRVFKVRSPMSVGVWGLVAFSGFSGLSAMVQAAEDGLLESAPVLAVLLRALPGRAIAFLGIGPAFFLGGYTGVLLAATAVPLWTRRYLLMGPLFLTSALSTGTAAVTLVLSMVRGTSDRTMHRLERLDSLTLLAEMGLLLTLRNSLGPVIGRPLREGRLAMLDRVVLNLGLAAPIGLQGSAALFGWRLPRGLTAFAAALVLGGGYLLRYMMIVGGQQSADDPQATFELARADSPADAAGGSRGLQP